MNSAILLQFPECPAFAHLCLPTPYPLPIALTTQPLADYSLSSGFSKAPLPLSSLPSTPMPRLDYVPHVPPCLLLERHLSCSVLISYPLVCLSFWTLSFRSFPLCSHQKTLSMALKCSLSGPPFSHMQSAEYIYFPLFFSGINRIIKLGPVSRILRNYFLPFSQSPLSLL